MLAVDIDFARHTFTHSKISAIVAVGVWILLFIVLASTTVLKMQQAEPIKVEIDALEKELARVSPIRQEPLQDEKQIAESAEIAWLLNTPWASFFDAMETTDMPGVALLEVIPELSSGKVEIRATADSYKTMLMYLDAMRGNSQLQELAITSHEYVGNRNPESVQFTLQGRWNKNIKP